MLHFLARTPARRGRLIAALLVGAIVGACSGGGDGGTTGVNSGVTGSYTLETVNGIALPFVENGVDIDGPYQISLDSSSITLNVGTTFRERIALRFIQPGFNQTIKGDILGTYSVTGNALRMIATSAVVNGQTISGLSPDTLNATLANNVITTIVVDTLDDGSIFTITSLYRRK